MHITCYYSRTKAYVNHTHWCECNNTMWNLCGRMWLTQPCSMFIQMHISIRSPERTNPSHAITIWTIVCVLRNISYFTHNETWSMLPYGSFTSSCPQVVTTPIKQTFTFTMYQARAQTLFVEVANICECHRHQDKWNWMCVQCLAISRCAYSINPSAIVRHAYEQNAQTLTHAGARRSHGTRNGWIAIGRRAEWWWQRWE